jgi:fatty-acyl-CoA synthase
VNGVIAVLTHGASLVIQEAFEPGESLELIDRHACTAIYSTATMFQMLLEHPEMGTTRRTSLRTGMIGSMPVPDVVMRGIVERLAAPEIVNSYGQTEGSVSLLTEGGAGLDVLLAGVGPPIPGVEVKLIDPISEEPVAAGEDGEICVRGPHVMLGYYRMPEKTAEAIDREGWLRSGDLGRAVGDGLYRITGRLKDMYIHGGLKVFPAEVENVLYQHPAVLQAAVVGVPDPRLGEVGHAFVQLRPGAQADPAALLAFLRERLAGYKVPRAVSFVSEFPTTANGKIQKFRLRELAATPFRD